MKRRQVERCAVLCTVVGSHSYGINVAGSDMDYKGIFIAPKEYYYGLHTVEQKDRGWLGEEQGTGKFNYLDGNKDVTFYELRKYVKLGVNCNPNILELLYEKEDMYTFISPLGQRLLDNRDLFLSKKVRHSYAGYAHAQIRKIKTHRRWLLDPPKVKPELKDYGLDENTALRKEEHNAFLEFLYTLVKDRVEFYEEADELYDVLNRIDFKGILRNNPIPDTLLGRVKVMTRSREDFMALLTKTQQYRQALKEWKSYESWKKNRNAERAALERKCGYDSKHAAHCLRLLRMGNEILRGKGVIVYRKDDGEYLRHVRLGDFPYDAIMSEAEDLEKQLDAHYKSSRLPHSVDTKKIDSLLINMVSEAHAQLW